MQSKSKHAPRLLADDRRRTVARATSYDVARLAGVSQSAVSRAFREGGSISQETRAKVEEAARELNYAPSQIARSLITQRSRMIGVVVTDLTTRNYPDVLIHLGEGIQASGNRMLVFAVPNENDIGSAADLLAYHVDGIISGATLPDEMLRACERQAVPVVLYNRWPQGAIASAVGCDHVSAMRLLVDHLVEGAMERAVFLAGPRDAPVSEDRLAAARAALAAHGRALQRVVHGDYSYESGRALGGAILAARPGPDTILCANDAMALGVMDAARFDRGLRIPQDVAVTGFDDLPQSAWPTYAMTTMRQPVRRMTQTAVRLLLEQIDGVEAGGERRLLPATLKVRGSTRLVEPASPGRQP